MLPTEVLTAIIGLPLGILTLLFGWKKTRNDAILSQQQLDAKRIADLFAQGNALDARLVAIGDKLQEERESGLKSEARANAAEVRAESFKDKYDYSESERQRLFTLTQTLQGQLDDCRQRTQHIPQDRLG